MLFTYISQAIFYPINVILGWLPTTEEALPTAMTDAIDLLVSTISGLNHIAPVSEIFTILPFVIGVEVVLLTTYLVLWVVHLVRGN